MKIAHQSRNFILLNAISFQLVWWSGVLLGNYALSLAILLLPPHFYFTATPRADYWLMLRLGCFGFAVDMLLIWLQVLSFEVFPVWLLLLWLYFSLSLNASMAFMLRLPLWGQAITGAVFGALSYLAGARLGAVNLPYGMIITVVVLTLIWGFMFPFGLKLAKYSLSKEPNCDEG